MISIGSAKKSNQPTPTQKLTAECEILIKRIKYEMRRKPHLTSTELAVSCTRTFVKRRERNLRKHLEGLTKNVDAFLVELDKTMKGPSTVERGKAVARLANKLDMCNQYAKCFGL